MTFLRDCWRRSAFARYFAALDPIDRATFLIAAVLALTAGISFSAIAQS